MTGGTPAAGSWPEHLSPAVLVESHRQPGEVPHPPPVPVPGGARVEPAPVLDTSRAGQSPDGLLDGLHVEVGVIVLVHYDALGPVA